MCAIQTSWLTIVDGEIYPIGPGGAYGDPIGNVFDE